MRRALAGIAAALLVTPGAKAGSMVRARTAAEPVPIVATTSTEATQLAAWVRTSDDNAGKPFIIVDKRRATVFGFASDGKLRGTAPALLGLARGDVNPPNIGDRPLSAIGPQDRITAAGRYVATLGNDLGKADILWIDYASGLSLHRVIRGKPSDQRRLRLLSPSPDDRRISYGCVNVPASFFDQIVRPLFHVTTGIVYVLPEIKPLHDVFPMVRASATMPPQK